MTENRPDGRGGQAEPHRPVMPPKDPAAVPGREVRYGGADDEPCEHDPTASCEWCGPPVRLAEDIAERPAPAVLDDPTDYSVPIARHADLVRRPRPLPPGALQAAQLGGDRSIVLRADLARAALQTAQAELGAAQHALIREHEHVVADNARLRGALHDISAAGAGPGDAPGQVQRMYELARAALAGGS